MKILVTTPAGNIGRRVLSELLAPEFSVRVISPDPDRLPDEIREQVEAVRGSTDDSAALRRALEGVESLFWCVPAESLRESNIKGHFERFARAGREAVREAGTPRVVTISAGGKGLARYAGPISGLHAMEDILNESGAAIRHLRCGWFMEHFLPQARTIRERGVLSYPMPGHIAVPMVALSDIADTALRWLVRQDWTGVAGIAVHGPEELTYSQAAAVIERVLERPVLYKETSANHYVQTLVGCGASPEYARSLVEMFAELVPGHHARGTGNGPIRHCNHVGGLDRTRTASIGRVLPRGIEERAHIRLQLTGLLIGGHYKSGLVSHALVSETTSGLGRAEAA